MSADSTRYETEGPTWSQRASMGELNAVLSPLGTEHRNRFLHWIGVYAARSVVRMDRRRAKGQRTLVDFGFGTGRFVRYFGSKGYRVIGTEITPEMVAEAKRIGVPEDAELHLSDGISIPAPDATVDVIWICGVLKYSLFNHPHLEFVLQDDPTYPQIAREMYRVLKPGGIVANLEIFVDTDLEVLLPGFEDAGFVTRRAEVLQRDGRLESMCQAHWLPLPLVDVAAQLCAAVRSRFDDAHRPVRGIRDYFIVWEKPRR